MATVESSIERLLTLAALDAEVASLLRTDPEKAAASAGVALSGSERQILAAMSSTRLHGSVEGLRTVLGDRRAFLGRAAVAIGALAAGGCEATRQEPSSRPTAPSARPAPTPPPPDAGPPRPDQQVVARRSSTFFDLPVGPPGGTESNESNEGTIGLGTLGTITGTRPDMPGHRRGPQYRLDMSKPRVRGNLHPEIVRRILRRHRNELRYCWQRHRPRRTTRFDVQLRLQIDGQGQVTGGQATATETQKKHRPTLACIEAAARRWLFPRPTDKRPVEVEVSLIFKLER